MAVTKLFSEVTIGGNHIDNPAGYNWSNYDNYPRLDLSKTYQRLDVIAHHDGLNKDLQVTGLAEVIGGHAHTDQGDLCYLPCPDFC
jgi:hypothetical protein